MKEQGQDETAETNDMAWEGWEEHDNLEANLDDTKKEISLRGIEITPSPIRNKPLDLNSLDIKVSGGKTTVSGEDDFFADMEPAIPSSLCLLDILEEKKETQHLYTQSNRTDTVGTKFAVSEIDADTANDGWGEDDWGEDF